MIVVFQFFRAAAAIATHPGDLFAAASSERDMVAKRREEMNEIVQFGLAHLRDNSPVGSGRDPHAGLYRDSHTLFVNGNDVKDLSAWLPGQEIEISNPVPYARLLEVGDDKVRVPHNTYELAAQALQAKYGEVARIEFNYLPVRFGGIRTWSRSVRGRALGARLRRGNPALRAGWLVRQPALTIRSLV